MGGNLAVTLITEEGTTYKMDRWTNTFPNFVNNMKLVRKEKEHVQNYLEAWLEMKEDWEKNGPKGPFEFEMTNMYFPHAGMAPSQYGLVVIDMQKNKIYSHQGYSSPGRTQRFANGHFDEEDQKNLDEFEKENRVSVLYDLGKDIQVVSLDLSPFEVTIFKETKEEALRCMELLDTEYGLSKEEKETWKEFIEDHYEDEDDEEDEE